MVVVGKNWLCSGKLIFLGKVVVFGQDGCIWAKVVELGQKLLYSGKSVLLGERG